MHTTERAFTREERRAALYAILAAAAITVLGLLVQQWMGPSLGPWSEEQAEASSSGILDAQPVSPSALT